MKTILTLLLFIIATVITMPAKSDFNSNIKSSYYLEQARNAALPVTARVAYFDSLFSIRKDMPLGVYLEQGALFEEIGQYKKARQLYIDKRTKATPDSLTVYCHYLLKLATSEYYSNSAGEAVRLAYELLDYDKPDSLQYLNTEANRLLAHIFEECKTIDLSDEYMRRAMQAYKIFESSDAPQYLKKLVLGKYHYTMSSFLLSKKDYPGAFKEIKESRRLLENVWPSGLTALNIAEIYHLQGQYEMAEKYYKEVISVKDYHPDYIFGILNYAQMMIEQGKADEAAAMLNEYSSQLESIKGTPWEHYLYSTQYVIAEARGDYRSALTYLSKVNALADESLAKVNQLYKENLADHYEGRDRDSVIVRLNKNNTCLIWIVAFLGLATVIVSVLLFVRIRKLRRLKKTNEELTEAKNDYDRLRMEERKKAEESITEHSRQLSAMTLHMARLNKEIDKIDSDAADASLTREELSRRIRSSIKLLSTEDNVWEMFRVYFEEVNQRFFDNLFKAAPDLTKSEIRMCAFMLAGMTNKEIAAVTNRSVRTVDCIKYNLRRKLPTEEPTETYLRRLSAE